MFCLNKVKHPQIFRRDEYMDSTACMICGRGGHTVTRCPELVDPLRDGFYRGGGGGGGGGGGDDDEELDSS